jgi:mannonate dehydratase
MAEMSATHSKSASGIGGRMEIDHGVKLAVQIRSDPSQKELRWVKQMGIKYVTLWALGEKCDEEYYLSRRELLEEAGLVLYGFGNTSVHNQDAIVLNLPGRDEKIEEYKTHLRNLARAGIPYTTYAHMANGIWSTDREESRGGASSRAFNLETAEEGRWVGAAWKTPYSHGREYTEEEIWENYTYFIKQVVPVAEETGILIGIHPDDPPVPVLAGVPRCIFGNFEGYKRALEIADSPNVGMCLCAGCWLEGGELMGKDVLETIRYFGERKKIFKVHFRNVNQPLPHFVETMPDDGYMDMYQVMRALREVDFNGVVIPDHVPVMAGGRRMATAFTIGYMKALLERAEAEVGGT